MGLHHFTWHGKERAVSIHQVSDKVTLRFIDEEIIEEGFERITFTKGQSVEGFINNYRDTKQTAIKDLITAIQKCYDFARSL